MKYNFDNILERRGTSCSKYDLCEEVFGRDDIIPMWVADMDFEIAPFITEAIKNRAEHKLYGYDFRNQEFFNSVISWLDRRNGWKVEKDWITFTPGVVSGLVFSEMAFTDPGDKILIQPPVYPPFASTIKENDRVIMNNPLVLDNDKYVIDFDDLDEKLKDAKAFIFCNPQNPTGRVFTREELQKVGELCIKNDVILISDEIHSDLVFKPNRHIHIASLSPEIAKQTITLLAPSKTFNIAGLSTSVAIIENEDLRNKFRKQIQKIHVGEGTAFGTAAFTAAYKNGDEWLEELLEYLEGNINYVKNFLKENMPSIKTYATEGTYLLWLDFSGTGICSDELQDFLVNKAGLGFNDGRAFGREGSCHARMNLGTSRELIKKALTQLVEAIKNR